MMLQWFLRTRLTYNGELSRCFTTQHRGCGERPALNEEAAFFAVSAFD